MLPATRMTFPARSPGLGSKTAPQPPSTAACRACTSPTAPAAAAPTRSRPQSRRIPRGTGRQWCGPGRRTGCTPTRSPRGSRSSSGTRAPRRCARCGSTGPTTPRQPGRPTPRRRRCKASTRQARSRGGQPGRGARSAPVAVAGQAETPVAGNRAAVYAAAGLGLGAALVLAYAGTRKIGPVDAPVPFTELEAPVQNFASHLAHITELTDPVFTPHRFPDRTCPGITETIHQGFAVHTALLGPQLAALPAEQAW